MINVDEMLFMDEALMAVNKAFYGETESDQAARIDYGMWYKAVNTIYPGVMAATETASRASTRHAVSEILR